MINYPIFPVTIEQKKIINDFNNDKSISYQIIKCEICNSEDYKHLFNNDCWGFKQKLVYCKKCGFCFLNPRMDKESSSLFYNSDSYRSVYFNHDIKDTEDLYQKLFNQVKKHIPAEKKIPNYNKYYNSLYFDFINYNIKDYENVLDIGCGNGTKLIDFKNIGKKVTGVDLSSICHRIHTEFGINSIEGSIDDLENKKYDLVILSHVLEHLTSLEKITKKLSNLTNKYLYIEVPTHLKRLQVIQNAHNYYFTENTLNFFILNSNFELIDLKYVKSGKSGEYILALYKKQKTKNKKKFEFNFNSEIKKINYLYLKFLFKQLIKKIILKKQISGLFVKIFNFRN